MKELPLLPTFCSWQTCPSTLDTLLSLTPPLTCLVSASSTQPSFSLHVFSAQFLCFPPFLWHPQKYKTCLSYIKRLLLFLHISHRVLEHSVLATVLLLTDSKTLGTWLKFSSCHFYPAGMTCPRVSHSYQLRPWCSKCGH